jgi:DNA mismatch repair protein MutS2
MSKALEAELEGVPEDRLPDVRPVAEGATVTLRGSTERGIVDRILPDRDTAFVLFGNVRMKVRVNTLVPVEGQIVMPVAVPQPAPEESSPVIRDLDIRGMTGSEAIPLIEKFIDSAILSGLHRIDIIHGKGTGALRRKVAEFLSREPRVQAFRLGEWNEGGAGATVVELRDED